MDMMTSMKGIEGTFDDCLAMATQMKLKDVLIPVLHINHLIANKKAVARPKDQLDVIYLEKIQKLREDEGII